VVDVHDEVVGLERRERGEDVDRAARAGPRRICRCSPKISASVIVASPSAGKARAARQVAHERQRPAARRGDRLRERRVGLERGEAVRLEQRAQARTMRALPATNTSRVPSPSHSWSRFATPTSGLSPAAVARGAIASVAYVVARTSSPARLSSPSISTRGRPCSRWRHSAGGR
jgi:hypothetical protein